MPDRSPELNAAMRAVRGESDLDAIMPALADAGPARVIACAPETHHLVRAIAALRGGLTTLLAPEDIASPALHAAVARLIGTTVGDHVLTAWAEIAPVGWGRPHAEALRDAVLIRRCDPGVAAALIGPGDESAGLLFTAADIAFAIRRWGQSDPAAPIAWATALAPAKRDRLIVAVRSDSSSVASCLPWLPSDVAWAASENCYDAIALHAFAAASPTARALHAGIVQRLVDHAHPAHLAALTRLACAMRDDDIWRRVQTLIQASPEDAWRVVAAAPWDDLPKAVHDAILERVVLSPVCTAVAAARGQRDSPAMDVIRETAAAFFAALDPAVWDALDAATQQGCVQQASGSDMPLAVRSLGLRPDILARAALADDLARAAQQHTRDAASLRAALFPVALRAVNLDAAYVLIAAMPTMPPDPGAFFCIAGGRGCADLIASARATLRTPDDLACAVMLQCSDDRSAWTPSLSTLLQHALRERTWDDLAPILALLDDDARVVLMPDREGLVERLALPDRRDALRQALDRLATLPPAVAIPTMGALQRWSPWTKSGTAEAVADALRAHGDVFLTLADAVTNDNLRQDLLPLPEDARQANALRDLTRDDLPTARRLACALHGRSWRDALLALLTAPPQHAAAVWQALAETDRRAMVAVLPAGTTECAPLDGRDPITVLALRALQSDAPALRDAGARALAARRATLRAMWDDLPPEARHALRTHPAVAVAVADLGHPSPSPSATTSRTRRIPR